MKKSNTKFTGDEILYAVRDQKRKGKGKEKGKGKKKLLYYK